jgi:hypothetical protein
MRLRLHKIERGSRRNVKGKVVSRRYCYIIVAHRWFRKPLYLRLLPNWFDAYMKGEPCNVELTRYKGQATEFRDDKETISYLKKSRALELLKAIKKNPDNFILN